MTGIVKLLKAQGPLAEAFSKFYGSWGDEARHFSDRLGSFFQKAASDDPSYFTTDRAMVAGDDTELARLLSKKHGVELEAQPYGGLKVPGSGVSIDNMRLTPNEAYRQWEELQRMRQFVSPTEDTERMLAQLKSRLDLAKRAKMDLNAQFHNIDMIGAAAGTGFAGKAYPAFFDYLRARPGTAAYTSALTGPNSQKRVAHQVGALEKHPELRNRLETTSNQLDADWGAFDNEGRFSRYPVKAQIGALNAITANNTAARLQALMANAEKRRAAILGDIEHGSQGLEAPRDTLSAALDRARRVGLSEEYLPSVNLSEHDLGAIHQSIGDVAAAAGISRPVGLNTLRRAGLVNDVLRDHRLVPEDVVNTWITRGLARATGGRIPALGTSAGPLTQCGREG